MDEVAERRRRLTIACAMAGISKTELAGDMEVTGGALAQWERRGDPPEEPISHAHKAGRAQYDRPPISSTLIASAISRRVGNTFPAAALIPGGPWPVWPETDVLPQLLAAVGLEPSASFQEALKRIEDAYLVASSDVIRLRELHRIADDYDEARQLLVEGVAAVQAGDGHALVRWVERVRALLEDKGGEACAP